MYIGRHHGGLRFTKSMNRKACVCSTQVTEWKNGEARRTDDFLAGEEPLEMRIGNRAYGVTMRTTGNDRELVAGFLFTEGVISCRQQLLELDVDQDASSVGNVIQIRLGPESNIPDGETRGFSAGSACGVCGKASIEQIRNRNIGRPVSGTRFEPAMLCTLPDKLRAAQPIFGRTGGLHAAALFDSRGEMVVLREDIGRHNAVDKVIGWALNEDKIPLNGFALLVSGRGGFEIIQKALVAGIPLLASVSVPSSLAVQLARELGLTLVGFLRGARFVIYAGEERLSVSATAVSAGK
jgi:FdhD protein